MTCLVTISIWCALSVVLKSGKICNGDDEIDFGSIIVLDDGGGVGGLIKKSFDVSNRWFALDISSCARRTWSLCNASTSVTLRPLLINGFPLNDSGKCSKKSFSIVVECVWSVFCWIDVGVRIDENGIWLLRLVDDASEFE